MLEFSRTLQCVASWPQCCYLSIPVRVLQQRSLLTPSWFPHRPSCSAQRMHNQHWHNHRNHQCLPPPTKHLSRSQHRRPSSAGQLQQDATTADASSSSQLTSHHQHTKPRCPCHFQQSPPSATALPRALLRAPPARPLQLRKLRCHRRRHARSLRPPRETT